MPLIKKKPLDENLLSRLFISVSELPCRSSSMDISMVFAFDIARSMRAATPLLGTANQILLFLFVTFINRL